MSEALQESWGIREAYLNRLLSLLYRLMTAPRTVTMQSMCQSWHVSRRTALRDIAVLRASGVNVDYDKHARHYRITQISDEFSLGCGSGWAPPDQNQCIGLLALLDLASCPGESQLAEIRMALTASFIDWLTDRFGEDANTITANAKLLAYKPTLSVEEIREYMARFRSPHPPERQCVGA